MPMISRQRHSHSIARTTLAAALPFALGLASGCSAPPAGQDMAPTASVAEALRLPSPDKGIPPGYVVTPNGYFHSSCVVDLGEDERLRDDGQIERRTGETRGLPSCSYPRFDRHGKVQGANPDPTISGWLESASSASVGSLSWVSANWTVPPAPLVPAAQTIYYFPGVQPLSPNDGGFIMQPVLAWSDGQWTATSWNCCVNGTTVHGPSAVVQTGDVLYGYVAGTNCNGSGVCSSWTVYAGDTTTGVSSTLNTSAYGNVMNWAFGGVLEPYSIDTCAELPNSGAVTFSNVTVKSTTNATLAPTWTPWISPGVTPQCNYAVTAPSSSTVNVDLSPNAFGQSDVLGFESLGGWSSSAGTLALGTKHTQGDASLSVSGTPYATLTSAKLSSLAGVSSILAYDVQIPTNEPNPSWYGETQLFMSIPSQGVYNQYLGQVALNTLTPGLFGTAEFTVPSSLVIKLQGTYTDLTFSIVLNVPSPSPYGLDNLRFIGPGCVVPTVGMTVTQNTTLCPGTYPVSVSDGQSAITIGADDVTLACNGAVLLGSGAGTGSPPNAGIGVGAHTGDSVIGCTASSFRYGLRADGSTNLTVQDSHFDGNYSDATQTDASDDVVVGGGIGLLGVTGASVSGSSFANNWNGIEVRNSTGVEVTNNKADHCTNTGALLLGASASQLTGNDFSWAVRNATYPSSWYGAGTYDSAGILLDEGSTGDVIQGNDTTYGGDGIFIRALLGSCGASGNQVFSNQTSYSANNAIESWCPNNVFNGNTASYSQYGLWLGGSDAAQVIGNTASHNQVDGISIQIAADRHTLLQDNTIENNGRAGVLLSGLQYQAWDTLPVPDADQTAPGNSSQIVVQRNTVSGNAVASLFTSETRLLSLASNCGLATPWLSTAALLIAPQIGACGGAAGRTPPTAALANPSGPATIGAPTTFDASGSAPGPSGGTLRYSWLVQASGSSFSTLPAPVLQGVGAAKQPVTFLAPGFFDVDVNVDDGFLAALAHTSAAVVPGGQRFGQTAATWSYACSTGFACTATITDDPSGVEGSSVHVNTNDPFDFSFSTPAAVNASARTHLGFFVRASNTNAGGWQNFYIVLHTSAGALTYTPPLTVLPTSPASWVFLEMPLAGGTDQGTTWVLGGSGSLASLQSIEIHTDTWNGNPYDVWVDALSLY